MCVYICVYKFAVSYKEMLAWYKMAHAELWQKHKQYMNSLLKLETFIRSPKRMRIIFQQGFVTAHWLDQAVSKNLVIHLSSFFKT